MFDSWAVVIIVTVSVLTETCQFLLIFLCPTQFSDKTNNEVKVTSSKLIILNVSAGIVSSPSSPAGAGELRVMFIIFNN